MNKRQHSQNVLLSAMSSQPKCKEPIPYTIFFLRNFKVNRCINLQLTTETNSYLVLHQDLNLGQRDNKNTI